jgi:hypothetical protein
MTSKPKPTVPKPASGQKTINKPKPRVYKFKPGTELSETI